MYNTYSIPYTKEGNNTRPSKPNKEKLYDKYHNMKYHKNQS